MFFLYYSIKYGGHLCSLVLRLSVIQMPGIKLKLAIWNPDLSCTQKVQNSPEVQGSGFQVGITRSITGLEKVKNIFEENINEFNQRLVDIEQRFAEKNKINGPIY